MAAQAVTAAAGTRGEWWWLTGGLKEQPWFWPILWELELEELNTVGSVLSDLQYSRGARFLEVPQAVLTKN